MYRVPEPIENCRHWLTRATRPPRYSRMAAMAGWRSPAGRKNGFSRTGIVDLARSTGLVTDVAEARTTTCQFSSTTIGPVIWAL